MAAIGRKSSVRKSKKEMYYEYFETVDYQDFDQDNKSTTSRQQGNA